MPTLIETNLKWLGQALDLLEAIDDSLYTASPRRLAPHRAGSHLRHVLEFYECFLDGLADGLIDYDARRRDAAVERSRAAASDRIREIMYRLTAEANRRGDAELWVRREAAGDLLRSSVARELQVLSSHTIHHFALMAMTLTMLGYSPDPAFGVAPSTLRYQAELCAR